MTNVHRRIALERVADKEMAAEIWGGPAEGERYTTENQPWDHPETAAIYDEAKELMKGGPIEDLGEAMWQVVNSMELLKIHAPSELEETLSTGLDIPVNIEELDPQFYRLEEDSVAVNEEFRPYQGGVAVTEVDEFGNSERILLEEAPVLGGIGSFLEGGHYVD